MNMYQKIQRQILQEKIDKFNEDNKLSKVQSDAKNKADLNAIHENYESFGQVGLHQKNFIAEANRFNAWSDSVKEKMLYEFIMSIFDPCTDKILNEANSYANLKQNLVHSFIQEAGGASALLKQFKTSSNFLSEMALIIENAHKKVTSSVDPKDKEYVIDTLVKQDCFDKINMSNVEGICNIICNKVKDSIEDFVATNNENRAKIAEVLRGAKDKIQGSDDSMKESVNIAAQAKIRAIENSTDNILGEMVINMCKNLYKLPLEERANITKSNGKLDMESVVESCKCIYTFLEMVNTSRMHKFTTEELTDIVKNIGK